MARLPSTLYLMQQIGGVVILFEDGSEREIVRFDPTDMNATAQAQQTIAFSGLSAEDKSFAHFWAGYFYAHAGGAEALLDAESVVALMEALAKAIAEHGIVLPGPALAAYDKLLAQMAGITG
jgi:uncharacterized protein (DUF924 family)